jgi:hypothetical protein
MSQMIPPDIAAALGGGGAPQGGGGLPPDIGALLGAAGGAPADDGGAPLPSDGSPGGGQDALEQAIALLDQAIQDEADQEDQNVMRQCSAKLHTILAKNQKEADAMMGGSLSPAGARKAAAAQGYGG